MKQEIVTHCFQLDEEFGSKHLKLRQNTLEYALQDDEILLQIEANSLNYRDLLVVEGHYDPGAPFPLIPLSDAAARVVGKGSKVDLDLGELVTPLFAPGWVNGELPTGHLKKNAFGANRSGLLRSSVVLKENEVVRAPRGYRPEEAACLPCAALTAWHALFEEKSIKKGDFLVTQGTGGVSLFVLKFAKAAGVKVAILSSSDAKLEKARALGADLLINYNSEPAWSKIIKSETGGVGADHIIELGGESTLGQSVKAIKSNGIISLIGVLGGAIAPLNLPLVVMRNVRLQGVTVGSRDMHERMVDFIEKNRITPVISSEMDFSNSREAFDLIKEGRQFGKIVIRGFSTQK